jgi:hypothetical protein
MRPIAFSTAMSLSRAVSAAPTCQVQTPDLAMENGIVSNDCCAPPTVIFARGTVEPGNVGVLTGLPFINALRSKLGNGGAVVHSVGYPASLMVRYTPSRGLPQLRMTGSGLI